MEDIRPYESMAKLNLPDKEREKILALSNELMSSFDLLKEIDTENVAPMVTVLNIQNVFREDKSVKMLSREELLQNAPMQHDGYFQVPRTL